MEAMDLDRSFWSGRKVLVTGHTGFKGSWLSLWLETLGANVIGFSRSVPTEPSLYELAEVASGIESVTGDIRDFERLSATIAQQRPDVVFHLAAQSLVRRSFHDPLGTYETNLMGTVHVLEAVRRAGEVRVLINVTTDKVYENREWEWGYREDEPKGGHDPYASSKACCELATEAYRRSFFSPSAGRDGHTGVASARAGNVIGGGDWAEDRLVPDFMRSALAGRTLLVRNPNAIRPWQHVLNPLSGYLVLAQALWDDLDYAQGWNFGPEESDARPVRHVADRLCDQWGGDLRWEVDALPQPHEAHYLKLDSSRARARLDWTPVWHLEEGLRRTVQWFQAFRDGEDIREFSLQQIEDFGADRSRSLAAA